mmetsp:Transcript_83405/g.178820  ORF Transcript_83405/g.178820 Transcript_83405/m.178820 type:complete len:323 (+) Transcript_83405:639-1607(+)
MLHGLQRCHPPGQVLGSFGWSRNHVCEGCCGLALVRPRGLHDVGLVRVHRLVLVLIKRVVLANDHRDGTRHLLASRLPFQRLQASEEPKERLHRLPELPRPGLRPVALDPLQILSDLLIVRGTVAGLALETLPDDTVNGQLDVAAEVGLASSAVGIAQKRRRRRRPRHFGEEAGHRRDSTLLHGQGCQRGTRISWKESPHRAELISVMRPCGATDSSKHEAVVLAGHWLMDARGLRGRGPGRAALSWRRAATALSRRWAAAALAGRRLSRRVRPARGTRALRERWPCGLSAPAALAAPIPRRAVQGWRPRQDTRDRRADEGG